MTVELAVSLVALAAALLTAGRVVFRTEAAVEMHAEKLAKVDDLPVKVAELARDLHAVKNAAQLSEARWQNNHDEVKGALSALVEKVQEIALSNARIEAALKKE